MNTNHPSETKQPNQRSRVGQSILKWLAFNLVLLVLYLGFFNLCFLVEWPWTIFLGLLTAGLVVGLYVRFRSFFLNRYEVLFYSAIPLDVVMEGVSPYHTDHSFYGCAISFWMLFVGYRCVLLVQRNRRQQQVHVGSLVGSETGIPT